MSFVTKLFIVLLVICSLLLSASVVIFVNRVDNLALASKADRSNLAAARSQATSLQNRISEMDTTARNATISSQSREAELQRGLDKAQKDVLDALAGKAQAEKDLQIAQATILGANAVAQAAQTENNGLLKVSDDLRGKSDDLLKQNGELNTSLTVESNTNRALKHEMDRLQEQLAEANSTIRSLPKAGATSEANPVPPAPIAGKVTSVDIIGGKKYATISVGSADNVQKGMRFNVINSNSGEFLGFMTIDRVEPNEAIGPVDGTKIDKIQKDVDVRTQL